MPGEILNVSKNCLVIFKICWSRALQYPEGYHKIIHLALSEKIPLKAIALILVSWAENAWLISK